MEEMESRRSLEEGDDSFDTLSGTFSNQHLDGLTHPLRISCALCSSGSMVALLTSLTTSYWVTERSPQGLINSGLWETCMGPACHNFQFKIPEYLHITRAFLITALFCGVVSLIFVCLSFEHVSLGPVSFMVAAEFLSFTAGFFTLVGMSVFTVVYKSNKLYLQHLIIFGSSYGLCWASLPAYIITGIIIMFTHRTTRQ